MHFLWLFLHLLPVDIDEYRRDDHNTLDHLLPEVRHPDDNQAVIEYSDNQRTDKRSADSADTAVEAGTAKDNCGDGVEFVGDTEESAGTEEPGGEYHPGDAGEESAQRVDDNQDHPNRDTGVLRSQYITADRVDSGSEYGTLQEYPGHDEDQQRDYHHPRHAEDCTITYYLVRKVIIDYGSAVGEQVGDTAKRGHRSQSRNKGRHLETGDQEPVDRPDTEADEQRYRYRQFRVRTERDIYRHHRRDRQHGTDREVDTRRQDHHRHTAGDYNVHRRLPEYIGHIIDRKETMLEQPEDQHKENQNR